MVFLGRTQSPVLLNGISLTQWRLFFLLALVLTTDWFFFDRPLGVTVPLFVGLISVSAYLVRGKEGGGGSLRGFFVLPVLAVLPAIETINGLTVFIAIFGVVLFVLAANHGRQERLSAWVNIYASFLFDAPVRLIVDCMKLRRSMGSAAAQKERFAGVLKLILPVALTLGFLYLFTLANPLIEHWIAEIDLFGSLQNLDASRILFAVLMAMCCWPFLRVKRGLLPVVEFLSVKRPVKKDQAPQPSVLMSAFSVTASLIMFNLLFGVQTFLDVFYLWGSAELPEGVSYSEYAHRGTYVLIITALLAAAFILYVTQPRRLKAHPLTPLVKGLFYLWTAQNIVLVISTMLRMQLYVEAFALTHLRIFALIWMLLVMIGLALILARLVMNRSNAWLIKANLAALVSVLYVTSFVNLPKVIADYNVAIAFEAPDKTLDTDYLASLGLDALPRIHWVLDNWNNEFPVFHDKGKEGDPRYRSLKKRAHWTEKRWRETNRDWRAWTFRNYRLAVSLN